MLRCHFKTPGTLKRLSTDEDGAVSFEYVIVAACVVAAVSAVFNAGATGPIRTALTNAVNVIGVAVTTAVGG